jgi:aspartate 1-decarboxylase
MTRTFVNGKIHRLKVTALQPHYNGSCLIDPALLAASGIQQGQRALCVLLAR